MTHIFENATSFYHYIVTPVWTTSADEPTRYECVVIAQHKETGKLWRASSLLVLNKPEEEQLEVWKRDNASKYVESK